VSDEEIDAFLLKPLSDPLDDGDASTQLPPPPNPAAGMPPNPPLPPTRPASHHPKRLYRDPRGKIGGVASGLAHYFNIDVAIVRLILILLTLSFLPVPIYIAAWIAIPKAPTWPPPGPPQRTLSGRLDSRTLTAAGLLVGLIVVASAAGQGPGAVIVPVILVAVGVYLLNQPDRQTQTAVAASAAAGTVDPTAATAANYSAYEPASIPAAPAWAYESTAPAPVAPPPRRRRRIWLLFLLPLIPMAMVAGGGIAATSARDTTVTLGEASYRPQTVASIDESYSHSFGSITIDFTAVDFTDEQVDVEIKNTFGETYVFVPDDVQVTVDLDNDFGEAVVFNDSTSASGDYERIPDGATGHLHLSVDNSFGELRVVTD